MKKIDLKCLSIFLFIGIVNSFSQIIYHDLNPDVIFPSGTPPPNFSYNLDIDSDGTNDFTIQQFTYLGTTYYDIGVQNGSKVVKTSSYNVDTLNYGNLISAASSFIAYSGNFDELPSHSGTWYNVENKFVGICFNSMSGLKYGWIRIGKMMTILDYAYNDSPGQQIFAGEGLPNYVRNIQLNDAADYGSGADINFNFYSVFDESKILGYKVLVIPTSAIQTFNVDSAKQVSNSNSTFIPKLNKDIDSVLNSSSKDVFGNFITSLKPYRAFVLTLPDLVTNFDTLMSFASNELILQTPNLPAHINSITSTKIPSSFYNLNLSFNPPVSETGILNYRLFFINEVDSARFNIDTANNVSQLNYITISKTGNPQNLNFQSNLIRTHLGNTLQPFNRYKAILMSVTDTLNTNTSVLSNVSNSFTVYTQVEPVTKIVMSDIDDNHNISDINAYFTKVINESNISGYRGLVVPQNSAATFNLDSANASLHYMTFNKNGQDQNMQLVSNLYDIHGNAIQESQMYHFFVLTMSDNSLSDVNALSSVSKYFGFNSPNYFIANEKDTTSVIYSDIQDTSFFGQAYIMPKSKSIDFNKDGIVDLVLQASVWVDTGHSSVVGSDYAIPKLNVEISSSVLTSTFVTVHDSADMIFDKLNWTSSTGVLKRDNIIGTGYGGGLWNYNEVKFIAARLLDSDTTYAWIKLSVQANGTIGMTIYDFGIQKKSSVIGVREKEFGSIKINVYPNPSSEYFRLIFEGNEKVDMGLIDVNGKTIISKYNIGNDYNIDVSSLVKGMYGLRITTQDGKSKMFKLVVQ